MNNKVTSHTLRIDDNKELLVTVSDNLFIEDGYIHDKEGNIIMDINETYHAFYVTSHSTVSNTNETESFVFDTVEFIKYIRGFDGVDIRVFDSPLNSTTNPFKIETAVCESLSFIINNITYRIYVNQNDYYTTAEDGGIVKIQKYQDDVVIFILSESVKKHAEKGFFSRTSFIKDLKDKGLNCFVVS